MTNWRKILSWKQVPRELEVGSKVRVIATPELMDRIDLSHTRIGKVFTITDIDRNRPVWSNYDICSPDCMNYIGNVNAGIEGFPYSHWRDFLEIVG
jgi:hypothetical protein